jgi:2-polyprenyl-3-methyl-5-hydroxy-6-metoxy-1,4-benzoquinol methylase
MCPRKPSEGMNETAEQSKDQARWDEYGHERIAQLRQAPDKFIINDFPRTHHKQAYGDIIKSVGPLSAKKMLELGCGRGDLSVFLAKQGAQVTGVDVGEHLIAAARLLAEINDVRCEFQAANITDIPFDDNTYDVVLGIAILHHLSPPDLRKALQETHRVLKEDGAAFFVETVEDSKVFDFIQNIFPRQKKGSRWYRPSILQRKAWREYVKLMDDRALTSRELLTAGQRFRTVKKRSYGFLIRLQGLIGRRFAGSLMATDRILLRAFPPLRRLCQTVLVEYRK